MAQRQAQRTPRDLRDSCDGPRDHRILTGPSIAATLRGAVTMRKQRRAHDSVLGRAGSASCRACSSSAAKGPSPKGPSPILLAKPQELREPSRCEDSGRLPSVCIGARAVAVVECAGAGRADERAAGRPRAAAAVEPERSPASPAVGLGPAEAAADSSPAMAGRPTYTTYRQRAPCSAHCLPGRWPHARPPVQQCTALRVRGAWLPTPPGSKYAIA